MKHLIEGLKTLIMTLFTLGLIGILMFAGMILFIVL